MYLTVQCAKKSERHTVAISNKPICLAPQPMILTNEFTSVSALQELGDKLWFDITISQKALQTLVQISSNLPNSTFAFVVEREVFSTFGAGDLMVGRTFRFQGTTKERSLFHGTQKKLKAIVDSRTQ